MREVSEGRKREIGTAHNLTLSLLPPPTLQAAAYSPVNPSQEKRRTCENGRRQGCGKEMLRKAQKEEDVGRDECAPRNSGRMGRMG